MTATATEPDHRRTVLRVIVVTLVVLALTTAATVMVAYKQLDGGIARARTSSPGSSRSAATRSTSW